MNNIKPHFFFSFCSFIRIVDKYHYLKGQFSNPKKIYIDINAKDFKKIEYKREQALGSLNYKGPFHVDSGILVSSAGDFVPAKIRTDGKEVDAKLRLKGDMTGHIEGDKWSFRIKIKGDNTEKLYYVDTYPIGGGTPTYFVDKIIPELISRWPAEWRSFLEEYAKKFKRLVGEYILAKKDIPKQTSDSLYRK